MIETMVPNQLRCTLRISMADMVALGVRTRGLKKPQLPETLYQPMPIMGMGLMATLPYGDFTVSIPGECGERPRYPILEMPSVSADGFEIVYDRRTNGWYEASHVTYQSVPYSIEQFVPLAREWIEQRFGNLTGMKDRYAYFVPSLVEWDVIQRDGGYAAWDASAMPQEIPPELPASLKSPRSSGITARIPVFKGDDSLVPVFSQVEVMPNPDCRGVWSSFEEYKRDRVLRSQLPGSMVSDFREWLDRWTEESGFDHWIFNPGMLFGDDTEWWGEGCPRRTEHEGIDFAKGFRAGEGICALPAGTPVHSVAEGEVAGILDDFIGKSVVVRHPAVTRENGDIYYTVLSHIQPEITKLQSLAKGQIVGRIGKSTLAAAPMHLHLTGAWVPRSLAVDEIGLKLIHPAYAPVSLTNFNSILRSNPRCRFNLPPAN